ncbi:MAG TPA: DUF1566 domain-containing protein, partial [Gammaproteobacteria bacterium]
MGVLNKAGLMLVLLAPLVYAQYPEQDRGRSEAQNGDGQRCQTGTIVSTTPSTRYQQNKNGTVVDTETGLMWRICLEGAAGEACDQGEPLAATWAEALLYVPTFNGKGGFAGHTDWRLPNIRELGTLAELQCFNPAINLGIFPNAASIGVWSSSPALFHAHYSWYVDFEIGALAYGEREKAKAI